VGGRSVFETCGLFETYYEVDDKQARWKPTEQRCRGHMVTFLITSFLILALLGYRGLFWQKPASSTEAEALPPAPGRGLFIDDTTDGRRWRWPELRPSGT